MKTATCYIMESGKTVPAVCKNLRGKNLTCGVVNLLGVLECLVSLVELLLLTRCPFLPFLVL